MANLPDGVSAGQVITTVEDVKRAWGDAFILKLAEGEESVLFADDERVVYTAEYIYVRVSKAIRQGPDLVPSEWLSIKEPTIGQAMVLDRVSGEISQAVAMAAEVTGAVKKEIEGLRMRDIGVVSAVLTNFYRAG